MNPEKVKTRKKTRKKVASPKEVYALRSDEAFDESGVWVKVFLCYAGNNVQVIEFENGVPMNKINFNRHEAREYWDKMIRKDINMHRDDSYIKAYGGSRIPSAEDFRCV